MQHKSENTNQEYNGLSCKAQIDGYTDFIFINCFGSVQHQGTLNKALHYTFTTRLVEEGVNIKVVQDVLGHKDVETTPNIYTDVTKELKLREFHNLQKKMDKD